MNRRELIKSIPALVATPIAVASVNKGHLTVGQAYELKKEAKYLFVFKAGMANPNFEALRILGIQGVIQYVYDDPEECLKIYKLED